ncbi:arsenite-activated ATPase [Klebsiella pneumoniae subsp. pneumoniae]|uniref:Arsenite-activated ATPase n=1 Tax=Klebsiella pneumoniae subsp. pneumoniae TaxID=72407 RepID=A0A377YUX0_KLEPN|nr:arsenite-activated ATPase [Klebsiella pneumoniae subsp. pneumoniae]
MAAAVAVSLARRGHKVHLTTSDPAATCLTPWMARCQAFRSAVSIQKQRLSAIVALCWKIREKVWMKRDWRYWRKISVPLHRRDCRVSGILPDHQRGQRPFCHYRHCAHRAYAAVAGCNRGLSPGNGAPDGAGSRSRDNANDAAAGSGEDQSHYRDACRNHAVLEAAGLQQDLRRAGIEPWAWVINNSLAAAKPSSRSWSPVPVANCR